MPWSVYNSNGKLLQSLAITDDSIVEGKLDVSNAPTNGQFLQAQSGEGGGLTWAAASSGPSQATQSAIEAETNQDTYAPPDLIKHSPGVAKAWVEFQTNGNRLSSYNIGSVTDDGNGYWSPQIATDFSSVNYSAFVTIQSNDITTAGIIGQLSADAGIKAAGSLRVRAVNDSGSATDPTSSSGDPSISVVLFGDQ